MNFVVSNSRIVLDPIFPIPVIAALGIILGFITLRIYWRVGSGVERWRNVTLTLLRLAGIALVIVLLLQPSRQEILYPPAKERVTVLALDTSLSMKQRDMENAMRIEAARELLEKSEVISSDGLPASTRLRLFEFHADAQPVTRSVLDVAPSGTSTRLHKSVTTLLNSASAGESLEAIVLLTDGHDFELVNPVKTGAAARARNTPIYAVPLGKQGRVRDVSTRITGYQPYCYVKQKARVSAALRLIGCEFETLTVHLLRHGQVVQSRRVAAEDFQDVPVEFEVVEPETGQFEYEVCVQPLDAEVDNSNNSAITYLNVIDQQIRVLLLEGDPYWDTTFLQRSLMRNDKFQVDALISYGEGRVRAIRKTPEGELRAPKTLDELAAYDVVILGRAVDQLLDASQSALLEQFVKERSGTVIFSRGSAFETQGMAGELEPVLWGESKRDQIRVNPTAEGTSVMNLRASASDDDDGRLPELISSRAAVETKPLTATLAQAAGRDDPTSSPAIVHRRFGSGQVVSVGVEGLWRWSMNAKVEDVNSPFDRFWDQMILWLLAGRDFIPNRQFSFRPNSANIQLGEKIYFRLAMRQPDPSVKFVPLTLFHEEKEIARVNLSGANDSGRLTAEFLPERLGRYRALAKFPDGSSQESRFIVFTENLEETEVATDVACLRRLCESSGGRLIEPTEVDRLLAELQSERAAIEPKTRLRPLWNVAWVFYLAGLLFGLDWFLRRRWGLC